MSGIAYTPEPPYYAVIFTFEATDQDIGYAEMATEMMERVRACPGFLGVESAHEKTGIIVSYWDSYDAILRWKRDARHQEAKTQGNRLWYQAWKMRFCMVERDGASTAISSA